jgi:uroporphyrinogen III methyltransferase/synthase
VAAELNERVPLRSRALLDTRPAFDLELSEAVARLGFRHLHVPTIAIGAVEAGTELERVRARLDSYDWIVVTSRRGVAALLGGLSVGPRSGVRWAAVGAGTAGALAEHGVKADCVPDAGTADALPAAMSEVGSLRGARVLLARADAATHALPQQLAHLGAEVDDVVAYHTERPKGSAEPLATALSDPELEAVIFASGSAVKGLLELAGDEGAERARRLHVVTIGPKTSAVARDSGFIVTKEAATRDSAGLAAALTSALDEEVERWVDAQLRLPV